MPTPFSLTLEQVDAINLSLSRSLAVAQMVAGCGAERQKDPDTPPVASLFVVMQVIVEELGKIKAVMQAIDRE